MSYDLLFQQGIKLHEAGRFDEAEQIYRQILETAPNNPDIINLLGLIAQSKGLHQEAIAYFAKAIRLSPSHAPYQFNFAVSLEGLGKLREALDAYEKVITLAPDVKETYIKCGQINKELNNDNKAQNCFHKALELDPNYLEAKIELAKFASNPIDILQNLEREYPNSPLPAYWLSQYEQTPEAKLTQAQKAYKIAPTCPEFCLNLAEIYTDKKEDEKAEIYFRQAIQNDTKSIEARNALAALLTRKQKYKEAEEQFREVLNLSPQNSIAQINYADMLYRSGRLQEAVERYHEAVQLAPNSPEICNNFGIIQKDLGEYEEALALFFKALSAQPNRDEISINISETLTLLADKDPKKAHEIAANWLTSYPNNVFARHWSKTEDNSSQYSQKLFDNFAETYEQTLKNINYALPQELENIIGHPEGTILELGCGTGLIAEKLKTPQNTFIGIDISEKMIEKAKAKHIYKELITADILPWLQKNPPKVDLIIAADVFCYFADLEDIIKFCAPNKLCFSVEKTNNYPYEKQPNGRYKHHQEYISNLLNKYGYYKVKQKLITLRQENGKNVEGLIFTTQ